MPRKRRVPKRRLSVPLTPGQWARFIGDPDWRSKCDSFEAFILQWPANKFCGESMQPLWDEHKAAVLQQCEEDRPGFRPPLWWLWEAPRQPLGTFQDCYYDGELCEPRLLVRGSGRPIWEKLAYVPSYSYGIPRDWIDVDFKNPAYFESQAAYLKRHGLLSKKEKALLSTKDFEPVALSDCEPNDFGA